MGLREFRYNCPDIDKKTQTERIRAEMKADKIKLDVGLEKGIEGRITNLKIAEILGISSRQFERYLAGEQDIPQEIFVKLNALWKRYHNNQSYIDKYRLPNGFKYQDDELFCMLQDIQSVHFTNWLDEETQAKVKLINDRAANLDALNDVSDYGYQEEKYLDEWFNAVFDEEFAQLDLFQIFKLYKHFEIYVSLNYCAWSFILYYNCIKEDGKQILRESLQKYKKICRHEEDADQIKLCKKMVSSNDEKSFEIYLKNHNSLSDEETRQKLYCELKSKFNKLSYLDMEHFTVRMSCIYTMGSDDWSLLVEFFQLGKDSNYQGILTDEAFDLADNPNNLEVF